MLVLVDDGWMNWIREGGREGGWIEGGLVLVRGVTNMLFFSGSLGGRLVGLGWLVWLVWLVGWLVGLYMYR